MTNIPEDSMLRRHYLTEQQNKKEETIIYAQPLWSNGVLIPTIAFLFFLAVLFI